MRFIMCNVGFWNWHIITGAIWNANLRYTRSCLLSVCKIVYKKRAYFGSLGGELKSLRYVW